MLYAPDPTYSGPRRAFEPSEWSSHLARNTQVSTPRTPRRRPAVLVPRLRHPPGPQGRSRRLLKGAAAPYVFAFEAATNHKTPASDSQQPLSTPFPPPNRQITSRTPSKHFKVCVVSRSIYRSQSHLPVGSAVPVVHLPAPGPAPWRRDRHNPTIWL